MTHRFVIVDVFTRRPFGGNQLAVFPDARGLSAAMMQSLAREFNFAETTFVLPPSRPDYAARVRIFTPRAEVPFAGHPTIGTAAVLTSLGVMATREGRAGGVFEEGVGPIAVDTRVDEAGIYGQLTLDNGAEVPNVSPIRPDAALALSVPADAIRDTWFASAGLPFCFVHLAGKALVDAAVLDRQAWASRFARAWSPHLFFFAGDTGPGGRLYARMFAPALGVDEDPATGSACAALAGVMAERLASSAGTYQWTIEQGVALGRPSTIDVTATTRGGRVIGITVGGYTVQVGEGTITLPQDEARP
jgi:trans-2,3-dihydro-3-hydroxyanthranilate isomerase